MPHASRHDAVWMPDPPAAGGTKPPRNATTDVVVIGGGLTGLSAAMMLAEAGVQVMVLEALALGQGVTGRSTAQATEVLDHRYVTLRQKHGVDVCRHAAAASRAAIDQIETWARANGARHVDRRPAWLFGESAEDRATLEREIGAMREAGLEAVLEDRAPLPFATSGAIRVENQLQFDPFEHATKLANAARSRGVQIFEGTRVNTVEDGSPCVVHTSDGAVVKAKHVLVATHYPVTQVYRAQLRIAVYRSYVLAYPGSFLAPGLYFDLADPYHYLTPITTDAGAHVLVGGADHKTGQQPKEDPYEVLSAYASEKLGASAPAFEWSAQVEEPADGMPYIGPSSTGSNVFVATGYSGNGVTFATASAMMFRDHVLGRASPWASSFDPSRIKAAASAVEMVRENIDFPIHLLKDRIGSEGSSPDDVARGEGKILKVDGRRLAVHRDDAGCVHAVSAVCTHMGCVVRWNGLERTWDCPCHGSRFSADGKVLDGPATKPLEAAPLSGEPDAS